MSRSSTSVGSSKYSHPRVSIETFDDGQGANKETVEACKFVNEALHLRAKYLFVPAKPVHHDSSGVRSLARTAHFIHYLFSFKSQL